MTCEPSIFSSSTQYPLHRGKFLINQENSFMVFNPTIQIRNLFTYKLNAKNDQIGQPIMKIKCHHPPIPPCPSVFGCSYQPKHQWLTKIKKAFPFEELTRPLGALSASWGHVLGTESGSGTILPIFWNACSALATNGRTIFTSIADKDLICPFIRFKKLCKIHKCLTYSNRKTDQWFS